MVKVAVMDKVTGFEIPVENMEKERKFLRDVFGWETKEHEDDYVHIKTVDMDENWIPKERGAVNGGLYKRKSKNDKPMMVVTVSSIDDSLAKVEKAGGKVISPKEEAGDWGFWAEVQDPEGNAFELWEDKE